MIQKYFKYILGFLSLFLLVGSCSLDARRRHGHRGRVIYTEPRSAVRIGFHVGADSHRGYGSSWRYRNPWRRYRRRGFFGWWPWHEERVVVKNVYVDDNDDYQEYDDDEGYDKYDRLAEDIAVDRYDEDGVSVVKITLPAMEDSLFASNSIEYPSLAAICGAYWMNKRTICKDSAAATERPSGKKRIAERLDDIDLFDEGHYDGFINRALQIIKKNRRSRDESTRIKNLTIQDLESIESMHDGDVHIGFQGVASSADSLKTALKSIVSDIEDNQSQSWALPVYQGQDRWAAVKIEKKDGVVFVIIMVYE